MATVKQSGTIDENSRIEVIEDDGEEIRSLNVGSLAEVQDMADGETEPAETMSAMDKQYAALPSSIPRRIHILGVGAIGMLVAHSLKSVPEPPPITLMLNYSKYQQWAGRRNKHISLQDEEDVTVRTGFDAEFVPRRQTNHGIGVSDRAMDAQAAADMQSLRPHEGSKEVNPSSGDISSREDQPLARGQSNDHIDNLIVCTKSIATATALISIRHRITRDTTICVMHNGMGVIEELDEKVFPDESTRPTYVIGVLTHGANIPAQKAREDPFYVVHAGKGTVTLSIVPRQQLPTTSTPSPSPNDAIWSPTARYVLRTLTRCAPLCAVGFTPIEHLQYQLEKLAVNCIINPLTSLLDARNGNVLHNYALTRTMRLLLAEISLVIRSLPELQGIPTVPTRFSAERLEARVVNVAQQTAGNISSMLADVRAGRRTEIEYINGYVVRRGEELGIRCVVNYAIMQTVMAKALMVQREVRSEVPLVETEARG